MIWATFDVDDAPAYIVEQKTLLLNPEAFMRRVLLPILLCIPLALSSTARAQGQSSFFNGKDTTGWEGLDEYWSVTRGTLIGAHKGLKFNTFLCSKQKYTDF